MLDDIERTCTIYLILNHRINFLTIVAKKLLDVWKICPRKNINYDSRVHRNFAKEKKRKEQTIENQDEKLGAECAEIWSEIIVEDYSTNTILNPPVHR